MRPRVTVLKFGSSLLADPVGYAVAAEEIERHVGSDHLGSEYCGSDHRVLVVVSARRGATDRLFRDARRVSTRPGSSLLAHLLRTGEDASAALLGLTLEGRGRCVGVLTADELDLRTTGPLDDGEPCDAAVSRLARALGRHEIIVVPGFVGRSREGEPSTLGRGGSDYTALYLASRLRAEEVRLVKDVDGVHAADPRGSGLRSSPFAGATCEDVERVGNGVVQSKALRFADRVGLSFRVAGVGGEGTRVHAGAGKPVGV